MLNLSQNASKFVWPPPGSESISRFDSASVWRTDRRPDGRSDKRTYLL